MTRSLAHWVTALLLLCLFVPGFAAERDQGTLEIRIKDHRDAIDDFAKLAVTIDKIAISPKSGLMFWQTGWKELAASHDSVDLTKYVGKDSARVLRMPMKAGSFDAFHVKIKSIDAVLKKTQRAAQVKNTIGPVKLSFDIDPQGETLLVVDLTVIDLSDHPPRGYELSIKGYELYKNGKLIDRIPPG